MAEAQYDDYVQSTEIQILQLGTSHYLAIQGQGRPGGEEYAAKVQALRAVAGEGLGSAQIRLVEAIYWSDTAHVHQTPPEQWHWRLLVRVPDKIDSAGLEAARAAAARSGAHRALIDQVRRKRLNEGTVAQVLHEGPYAGLGHAYARLEAYLGDRGYTQAGRIHEIYLNNPDEVAPSELLTICRIPIHQSST